LNSVKANLYNALEKYYEVIKEEALIVALLDPRKKKMKFANNNQKESAKARLQKIYESIKNQQKSCDPKLKQQQKISKSRIYKKVYFLMINLMIQNSKTIKLKGI
jgi:hypothetical protein